MISFYFTIIENKIKIVPQNLQRRSIGKRKWDNFLFELERDRLVVLWDFLCDWLSPSPFSISLPAPLTSKSHRRGNTQ